MRNPVFDTPMLTTSIEEVSSLPVFRPIPAPSLILLDRLPRVIECLRNKSEYAKIEVKKSAVQPENMEGNHELLEGAEVGDPLNPR